MRRAGREGEEEEGFTAGFEKNQEINSFLAADV